LEFEALDRLFGHGVTGEQNDPNGLEFLRARYYDPKIGRFLSGDPVGGGYGYARSNPVSLTDPSGMVVVCTDWREGLCAGTTTIPDEFAGLYIAADSVQHWVPPKKAATPTSTSVGTQTAAPSDPIVNAEVAQATQEPTGGFDPGYDAGSPVVATVASDPYSQNEILSANSNCPAGSPLAHCMQLRTVLEIERHGPSECYNYGFECYDRLEMGLLGAGTTGLGLGIIIYGCEAGAVLCPVAVVSGGIVIGAGVALVYTSQMPWH
jgi:RHS repeat-associated protein